LGDDIRDNNDSDSSLDIDPGFHAGLKRGENTGVLRHFIAIRRDEFLRRDLKHNAHDLVVGVAALSATTAGSEISIDASV
jgi:hypothetical protein